MASSVIPVIYVM